MKKDELLQIVGRNLQDAIDTHPIYNTQTALAKRSGIAQTHISRIINGKNAAGVDTIAALTEALGLMPWELLVDNEATRAAIIERAMSAGRTRAAMPAKVLPMKGARRSVR